MQNKVLTSIGFTSFSSFALILFWLAVFCPRVVGAESYRERDSNASPASRSHCRKPKAILLVPEETSSSRVRFNAAQSLGENLRFHFFSGDRQSRVTRKSSVYFRYARPGTFKARVVVRSSCGAKSAAQKMLTVCSGECRSPESQVTPTAPPVSSQTPNPTATTAPPAAPSQTFTPTSSPTNTRTASPTATATATRTATATQTPTVTPSPSPTLTPTPQAAAPALCSNGLDDDSDGLADYPVDPGCSAVNDTNEGDERVERVSLYTYAWGEVREPSDGLVQIEWASLRRPDLMREVVERVSRSPEGHRVLGFWDFNYATEADPVFHSNPADSTLDPVTGKRFAGLWWDHGVESLARRVRAFLEAFRAAGGKLDYHVFDIEEFYMFSYGLQQCDSPPLFRVACSDLSDRFRAIEQDARYQADILPRLRARGFPGQGGLGQILSARTPRNTIGDPTFIWDSVMEERIADYYRQAVVEPTLAVFPNAKISNYEWAARPQELGIPDRFGNRTYLYSRGEVVGTHHAPSLYGYLNGIENLRLDGINPYEATPFNALRYELNSAKASILSGLGAGVSPWVAFRSFGLNPRHLFRDNDMQQELLIHLRLLGVDSLLYWNPKFGYVTPALDEDDRIFSATTQEVARLVGFADLRSKVMGLTGWGDDAIISCATAAGREVCRVSTNPARGSVRELVSQTAAGVTVSVAGERRDFAGAVIYEPANSPAPLGVWIVGPILAQ